MAKAINNAAPKVELGVEEDITLELPITFRVRRVNGVTAGVTSNGAEKSIMLAKAFISPTGADLDALKAALGADVRGAHVKGNINLMLPRKLAPAAVAYAADTRRTMLDNMDPEEKKKKPTGPVDVAGKLV